MKNRPCFENAGFTLVELIVVVVIIAILAAVAVPIYSSYVIRSRTEDGSAALSVLKAKQEIFRSTNFRYASSLDELPGYEATDGVATQGSYYYLEVVSADTNTFVARAWDGQESIGKESAGSDEWRISNTSDEPCHTLKGYGEDADPCADNF